MGDLPKWKMVVSLWWVTYPDRKKKRRSHYNGWPAQMKDKKRSHCNGWPTQMEKNGLIIMGDLPRCKTKGGLIIIGDLPKERWSKYELVSLLWVTYPNGRWSHCDGWPTQQKWWSHYDGWPTQMEDDGLIMMGDLPKGMMMVSLWWVTYPNEEWKVYEVVSLVWVVARRKNPARRPRPGDGGDFSLLLELIDLEVAT